MKRILILTDSAGSRYYSSLKILCDKNKDIQNYFPEFNARNIGIALRNHGFYWKKSICVERIEINM